MPQSYCAQYIHFVFSTKGRQPFILPHLHARLYSYIGGILKNENSSLLAVGGTNDHLHLLVAHNKETSLSQTMRLIKANSSKWVHETFPDLSHFAWQSGYGAFSVSHSNLDQVKFYLRQQQEHHRTHTFQDEFLAFLCRHEIPFEERYLWG